jgi:hypothetical protein
MILRSSNGCLHEKPLAKGGDGKRKLVLIHIPGPRKRLALRKCVMCARNMGVHVRGSNSEYQRYKKTGQEIGFPCSQERCKETSK